MHRSRSGLKTLWVLPLFLAACSQEPPPLEPKFVAERATSIDASATELIVIRDEQAGIEVAVAPSRGGELAGLSIRRDGIWIETLYRGRDYSSVEGFKGKGPFLWPATGRNFPPDLEKRRQAGESFKTGEDFVAQARRIWDTEGLWDTMHQNAFRVSDDMNSETYLPLLRELYR